MEAPFTATGRGHDVQHVVHPRGLGEIDVHRARHEGKARQFRLRRFE
jgi:hypothetical protein